MTVCQKFTKLTVDAAPPPRPPKPPQLITGHNYFNLMPAPAARNKSEESADSKVRIVETNRNFCNCLVYCR